MARNTRVAAAATATLADAMSTQAAPSGPLGYDG